MLRLAQKAFYPGPIPFPLLHVDTTYKFREMIEFRDEYGRRRRRAADRPHQRGGDRATARSRSRSGTQRCCGLLKTKALLDALQAGNFDAAFGGARRDEERSRAKERIFSLRDANGQWDPKRQRPELWNLLNGSSGPARASASSRSRTGPRSTSGSTSTSRTSRSCRSTSPRSAR